MFSPDVIGSPPSATPIMLPRPQPSALAMTSQQSGCGGGGVMKTASTPVTSQANVRLIHQPNMLSIEEFNFLISNDPDNNPSNKLVPLNIQHGERVSSERERVVVFSWWCDSDQLTIAFHLS